MPYSEKLADRIRIALMDMDIPRVEEKKMFRGMTFMVDDKMCISVGPDRIMCRVDPEMHDRLLEEKPCRTMIMKGREYKGYILVNEDDLTRKAELDFWIKQCVEFNARAKASKKTASAKKTAATKKTSPARKATRKKASTARKKKK
ncbi:MAG TPA: TfoX/Sxy family protein [Puia sp.]|nr:TfoX/Sxy family protein [Puia sp.]